MLLLNLVDVVDEAIIADYAISECNLSSAIAMQKKQMQIAGYDLPAHLFSSAPMEMIATLKHLREKYQDANGYLRFCGLEDSEIEQLKRRFRE